MKRRDLPTTLEGKPFATGAKPLLTEAQRAMCREVELKRRQYMREIHALQDKYRALPTRRELADELGCSIVTVEQAARGRVYQRDRFAQPNPQGATP